MRKQQYIVKLSGKERSRLEDVIRKGKSPAKKQLKARILYKAGTSKKGAHGTTRKFPKLLARIRSCARGFVGNGGKKGLKPSLSRKQRATPPAPRIFDGEKEAKLIALACSPPPAGRKGWTLRLLENKVAELNIVDHASDNTIGRVLKKTGLSPTSSNNGLFHRSKTARL